MFVDDVVGWGGEKDSGRVGTSLCVVLVLSGVWASRVWS
jgi:hypothetical protein